jgi:hypothetical protein
VTLFRVNSGEHVISVFPVIEADGDDNGASDDGAKTQDDGSNDGGSKTEDGNDG